MPIPAKYQADFREGHIYHVFNRTNNKERLFLSDDNRNYFLRKYYEYLGPYAETFGWCLLPNHFHLLLRIKDAAAIRTHLQLKNAADLTITERSFQDETISLSELVERSFKNMFQSYSLAFNRQHRRRGNLFCKPFRRVEVGSDRQFTQAIVYVHANPQKHGVAKDFRDYQWSSYHELTGSMPTPLARDEVLAWFGSKELFRKALLRQTANYYSSDIGIEE